MRKAADHAQTVDNIKHWAALPRGMGIGVDFSAGAEMGIGLRTGAGRVQVGCRYGLGWMI